MTSFFLKKPRNFFLLSFFWLAGLILTGNEISQILLALFLTYFGGQRNRPRWIACGMILSAMSCFILAWPHFIYGAGNEALQYTKEYGSKYEVTRRNKLNINRKYRQFALISFIEYVINPSIKPYCLE